MITKFKTYRQNLAAHPEQYWFRRKLYGWGWTPVCWQAWVVVIAFIAYVVWCALALSDAVTPDADDWAWYFVKLFAGVLVMLAIAALTGETPRWQWGPSKTEKPDQNQGSSR